MKKNEFRRCKFCGAAISNEMHGSQPVLYCKRSPEGVVRAKAKKKYIPCQRYENLLNYLKKLKLRLNLENRHGEN